MNPYPNDFLRPSRYRPSYLDRPTAHSPKIGDWKSNAVTMSIDRPGELVVVLHPGKEQRGIGIEPTRFTWQAPGEDCTAEEAIMRQEIIEHAESMIGQGKTMEVYFKGVDVTPILNKAVEDAKKGELRPEYLERIEDTLSNKRPSRTRHRDRW